MSRIRGAVAVITGAGSGIGRALAQQMAAQGAHLALADVNSAILEETRTLLGTATVRTYIVDVASAAAMEDFALRVERDFGRLSILINNAGVALFGAFAELSLSEFDWLFRINFWGVVHGCKFFLPLLLREKEARIVNVSSVFGLFGPPGQSAYCASKFAVRGFSESLREELRGTSVNVTCVHPAGIATSIAENARAGAATRPQEQEAAKKSYARVLRIPPELAAGTIVQGIMADKNRVLIGRDAYRIDLLCRLFPARASAMLTEWIQKRTLKNQAAMAAVAQKSV